jgi:thiol:disulfide interchange protein
LSGVLATIVATPCTAPFMGSALGYAITLSAFPALLIFTALGVGMAAPYVVLTTNPRLLRFVPKPGPWMTTMKRVLGVLLLATAAWLTWVFWQQTRPTNLIEQKPEDSPGRPIRRRKSPRPDSRGDRCSWISPRPGV